jgi:hypothetical protein
VPGVTTTAELLQAVEEFAVTDLSLVIEPGAFAAAQQSLAGSGLLLLGEVHGVQENPLLMRALMEVFGLTCVALEWAEELAPVLQTYLAEGRLTDHPLLWSGDGRITAGHLAVLAERAAAGPLEIVLFDGVISAHWSWSQRDEAMAERILASAAASTRTLVVAGNAHTPTERSDLGVPMGAELARRRPGVRDICIRYGGGSFFNFEPREFAPLSPRKCELGLRQQDGALVLDLPAAHEAVVPHRPGDGLLCWPRAERA